MPNQQSSGGDSEACQLKAGHPPAVKVGNMRISQRTHSTSSTSSDKAEESDGSKVAPVPSACSFAPKTDVKPASSGLPEKVAQNVVAEAVRQIHDKPQATHDYRGHSGKPNVIQQPKK